MTTQSFAMTFSEKADKQGRRLLWENSCVIRWSFVAMGNGLILTSGIDPQTENSDTIICTPLPSGIFSPVCMMSWHLSRSGSTSLIWPQEPRISSAQRTRLSSAARLSRGISSFGETSLTWRNYSKSPFSLKMTSMSQRIWLAMSCWGIQDRPFSTRPLAASRASS